MGKVTPIRQIEFDVNRLRGGQKDAAIAQEVFRPFAQARVVPDDINGVDAGGDFAAGAMPCFRRGEVAPGHDFGVGPVLEVPADEQVRAGFQGAPGRGDQSEAGRCGERQALGEFLALRDAAWGEGALAVCAGEGFGLAMADDVEVEGQLGLVFRIA